MMFRLQRVQRSENLLSSQLLNQDTFYQAFARDLARAQHEVIIESPFMSLRRLNYLLPALRKLAGRQVRIFVNTKPLAEQYAGQQHQVDLCIVMLQQVGAEVFFTGGHHRKLAVIDRQILYEGSLNILSQYDSCELMRRIDSEDLARQTIKFIGIDKFVN